MNSLCFYPHQLCKFKHTKDSYNEVKEFIYKTLTSTNLCPLVDEKKEAIQNPREDKSSKHALVGDTAHETKSWTLNLK